MSTADAYYIRGVGKTFGPVERATLIEWARDARIEPSFSISTDQKTWTAAPRMAFLEMDWLVETDVGTFYGPFNRAVVDMLVKDGTLPMDARLYRLDGGMSAPVQLQPVDAECDRLAAEAERLTAALAAKEKALSDLEVRAAQQATTTQKTMAFMEAKLAELSRTQAEATTAAQKELEEARASRDALQAELAAAQHEIYAGRERTEKAVCRMQEAETHAREHEQKAAQATAEKQVLEKRLAVVETELADVRAQLEAVTRITHAVPPAEKTPQGKPAKADAATKPVVPEVIVDEVPPKVAPRFGGKNGAAGLAALEAAAARELAAAKKNGIDIRGLFGGRK